VSSASGKDLMGALALGEQGWIHLLSGKRGVVVAPQRDQGAAEAGSPAAHWGVRRKTSGSKLRPGRSVPGFKPSSLTQRPGINSCPFERGEDGRSWFNSSTSYAE